MVKGIASLAGLLLLVAEACVAQLLPVPSGTQTIAQLPVAAPITDETAAASITTGLGEFARGGQQLSIRVATLGFDGAIDVYFGIHSTVFGATPLLVLQPGGGFAASIAPFRANSAAAIDRTIFTGLNVAAIPPGRYDLFVLVTPAGDLSRYYLWHTRITIVPAPVCAAPTGSEPTADGDYRLFSQLTGISIGDVAIADRGRRAVAGGQDFNIYYYSRAQGTPVFTFTTGGQVNSVDISRDGRAFVAGSDDGLIRFFECDQSTPAWSYDTAQDISAGDVHVNQVAISRDNRWVAGITDTHVYLFRRDSAVPVLKTNLSGSTNGATLRTLDLSGGGFTLVVGTDGDGTDTGRLFLFSHTGMVWSTTVPNLGSGIINNMPIPLALAADGSALAAGGDDRIRMWDVTSALPRWTHQITAADTVVLSVDLSDDGSSLAAGVSNELYFTSDTDTEPDFSGGNGSWIFDGWWAEGFAQPSVYPGHDTSPGDTYLGIGGQLDAVSVSADGNYVFAGDFVFGYAFSFYKEFAQPFRLYHLSSTTDSVDPVHLSPDGAWAMMGSTSGEIVRVEIAPAEFIRIDVPVTYRILNDSVDEIAGFLGANQIDVDYWVLKPGRAANLREEWALWVMTGGAIIPPALGSLCSGDFTWNYDQMLPDGNQIVTGTRELEPPQCLESGISTIDLFLLLSDLTAQPSGDALSDDDEIFAVIQVGTGSP